MNPILEQQNENKKQELIEARLSDSEKDALYAFAKNEKMLVALEKVMTYLIYMAGTVHADDKEVMDINWAFIPHNTNTTDEELGRELRAKIAGLSFLEDAFKQIKKFGVEKLVMDKEPNPAI